MLDIFTTSVMPYVTPVLLGILTYVLNRQLNRQRQDFAEFLQQQAKKEEYRKGIFQQKMEFYQLVWQRLMESTKLKLWTSEEQGAGVLVSCLGGLVAHGQFMYIDPPVWRAVVEHVAEVAKVAKSRSVDHVESSSETFGRLLDSMRDALGIEALGDTKEFFKQIMESDLSRRN